MMLDSSPSSEEHPSAPSRFTRLADLRRGRKRRGCCASLRSGNWGRLHGEEVAEFETAVRRDARLQARHRRRERHGLAAHRAAGGGHPRRGRSHRPALHLRLDRVGRDRGQRDPGVRGHRSGHVQSRSRGRRGRDHAAHQGHHPGAFRRAARRHGRDHGDRARARPRRDRRRRPRARRERTAAVPPARSATWRRSRSSRARTSRPAKAASSRPTTIALAEACRSIHNCGRVPDGVWYEHHVVSGNYRLGEFQGAVLNCQLDRLEEQTATRDAQRPAPRVAPRRAAGPSSAGAPGRVHAAQLSPVHAAARRGGVRRAARRRARGAGGRRHPVLRRLRLFAAAPAALSQQGVRPVSAERLRPSRLQHAPRCPNSDLICREQASGSNRTCCSAPAPTSTTSPAPSRRSMRIARR